MDMNNLLLFIVLQKQISTIKLWRHRFYIHLINNYGNN